LTSPSGMELTWIDGKGTKNLKGFKIQNLMNEVSCQTIRTQTSKSFWVHCRTSQLVWFQ
jgi:hypothetical protein